MSESREAESADRNALLMKVIEGTASSFRWVLASLLAVNGGALVALLQSGVEVTLIREVGWCFLAGLGASLLAGTVSWWAMVLTALTMLPPAPGESPEKVNKLGWTSLSRRAFWTHITAIALLIGSLMLTLNGFVGLQLSLGK